MRTADSLKERTGATHILSALTFDLEKQFKTPNHKFIHKKFDLLDFEDEDILTHIPDAIRFIEDAFYPAGPAPEGSTGELADRVGVVTLNEDENESATSKPAAAAAPAKKEPVNSVFVHCAMGKSRSVTLVVAWLLYKYPQRWRLSAMRPSQVPPAATPRTASPGSAGDVQAGYLGSRPLATPKEAVDRAINWVRDSRSIAEPNEGFHKQLQLWWKMGCPVKPREMEAHPIYARWVYKREVDAAVSVGIAPAPENLRFEDEAVGPTTTSVQITKEYRCSKCRGRLCDSRFMQEHVPMKEGVTKCPHVYIEPLSWMRETLEQGEMEGRLTCPGKTCGNQVGRYSWKGFKCSCGEWITPAFSLQRAKVDEVDLTLAAQRGLNIRMPPRVAKESL
ncbi:Tyrosine-protein phosphatase yvh1 [Zalerion maritima]|uniref:protein-tyrosine-phosphatase n=1 Tax=Zalerion maritima TaxID=339359 RepID=A0AAD5S0P9_9PEZI|nr:Tyrosine-protein phosphatase yvh1 [Zalerion maritima]